MAEETADGDDDEALEQFDEDEARPTMMMSKRCSKMKKKKASSKVTKRWYRMPVFKARRFSLDCGNAFDWFRQNLPFRGHSSLGERLWHARGQRFDSAWLHHCRVLPDYLYD